MSKNAYTVEVESNEGSTELVIKITAPKPMSYGNIFKALDHVKVLLNKAAEEDKELDKELEKEAAKHVKN